jgi:hypothetical protein
LKEEVARFSSSIGKKIAKRAFELADRVKESYPELAKILTAI